VVKERDFSHLKKFPGETGNPFDIFLHRIEIIQQIPRPVFALLLLVIAGLAGGFNPITVGVLWAFFLVDWMLIEALPLAGRSYGPPQPPTLILTILRSLLGFIPGPLMWLAQLLGTGMVVYAFWFEPHRLTISYQHLTTTKLKSQKPIRLVHLGDLHVERTTGRDKHLMQILQELNPDIILFSGDILNLSYLHDPQSWADARAIFSQIHAPYGVYLVTGSSAVDLPEVMPDLLKELPMFWLQDEKVTVEIGDDLLDIIGVTCTHRPHLDGKQLEKLALKKDDRFTILLYHSPDLAPAAARLGIDLQLSGHTHGGQVRLPGLGAIFTGSLYGKAFEAGRRQIGSLTLYVTRGVGMEGSAAPRLRFFCPPEVILWEISSGNSQAIKIQGE
jgi:predicted MPP superfamily phosphohydrolase